MAKVETKVEEPVKVETKVEEPVEVETKVEELIERDNSENIRVVNSAHFAVAGILPGQQGIVTYGVFKSSIGLVEVE
jgi:hypothetical protein